MREAIDMTGERAEAEAEKKAAGSEWKKGKDFKAFWEMHSSWSKVKQKVRCSPEHSSIMLS
jgi:hypothetical protein